uniref:Uncharacterized protein n=1 Tax=Anguilla anguilla TaxID=7936 RepID=A0A0E9VDR3_ANGAN
MVCVSLKGLLTSCTSKTLARAESGCQMNAQKQCQNKATLNTNNLSC